MPSLKKKENEFFVYLEKFAEEIVKTSALFCDLVKNFDDLENKIKEIKRLEHECDTHAHKIFVSINESFVTPFDREDLYAIVREMDDIVDAIEEVACNFVIYDVKGPREGCAELAALIDEAVNELAILFKHLSEVKKNNTVHRQIVEVNRIENEGDLLYRDQLSKLFREEKDPIELLKWKILYDDLEDCLDSCEQVANILEGVVMKYA